MKNITRDSSSSRYYEVFNLLQSPMMNDGNIVSAPARKLMFCPAMLGSGASKMVKQERKKLWPPATSTLFFLLFSTDLLSVCTCSYM